MSDDALRNAISIHFWGRRPESNADKIADDLVPELLDQFYITPKRPIEAPFTPVEQSSQNPYGRSYMPSVTKIEIDRTVPIADAGGAMIGYSNAHPDRRFLIIPQEI
jgi:hypothetical protein